MVGGWGSVLKFPETGQVFLCCEILHFYIDLERHKMLLTLILGYSNRAVNNCVRCYVF